MATFEEFLANIDKFHELANGYDEETLKRLDAELEAKLNDPNYQPRKVNYNYDPDPFGMDWKWAEPSKDGE